ncbi:Protein of unknown function, partial [Cotesia congregata]
MELPIMKTFGVMAFVAVLLVASVLAEEDRKKRSPHDMGPPEMESRDMGPPEMGSQDMGPPPMGPSSKMKKRSPHGPSPSDMGPS